MTAKLQCISKFKLNCFYEINTWRYSTECHISKVTRYASKRQKHPPEVFYKKSVLRNFTKFTGRLYKT